MPVLDVHIPLVPQDNVEQSARHVPLWSSSCRPALQRSHNVPRCVVSHSHAAVPLEMLHAPWAHWSDVQSGRHVPLLSESCSPSLHSWHPLPWWVESQTHVAAPVDVEQTPCAPHCSDE